MRTSNIVRSLTLGALVGTSLLGGCTLTKLWDFPLGECETNSDCLVLTDDTEPASCQQFVCQAQGDDARRVCVAVTDEEICDGADNDGDMRIDCDDPNCLNQTCGPGCTCRGRSTPAWERCSVSYESPPGSIAQS